MTDTTQTSTVETTKTKSGWQALIPGSESVNATLPILALGGALIMCFTTEIPKENQSIAVAIVSGLLGYMTGKKGAAST